MFLIKRRVCTSFHEPEEDVKRGAHLPFVSIISPTHTHVHTRLSATCIRAQQLVDYQSYNAAICFDICGFDMYLKERRFR